MPLKWNREVNPYLFNYYGILGVGPNFPYKKIAAVAQDLCRKIEGGHPPSVAGQILSVFQVNEACNKLAEGRNRAMELLLVHPEFQHNEEQLGQVATQLKRTAVLPDEASPLPLKHPLAIFSFLPLPDPETAPLPPWQALDLVEAGSPRDLDLDIVFDQ